MIKHADSADKKETLFTIWRTRFCNPMVGQKDFVSFDEWYGEIKSKSENKQHVNQLSDQDILNQVNEIRKRRGEQ